MSAVTSTLNPNAPCWVPRAPTQVAKDCYVIKSELNTLNPYCSKYRFKILNVTYTNTVQAVLHRLALMYNDNSLAKAILLAETPGYAEELGMKLRTNAHFHTHVEKITHDVYYYRLKGSQMLRNHLSNTTDKQVIMGYNNSTIWGVGFDWQDDSFWDFASWKGDNLIGNVLMKLRKDPEMVSATQ